MPLVNGITQCYLPPDRGDRGGHLCHSNQARWYSIYRPRKDERPSWLVTYRKCLPVHRRSPIRVLDTLRGNSGATQLSYICRICIPLYKILHDRYDRRVAPRHVSIAKPQFSLHWVGSISAYDTFGTKGGRFRYMSISVQMRSRSVHGNSAYATSVHRQYNFSTQSVQQEYNFGTRLRNKDADCHSGCGVTASAG